MKEKVRLWFEITVDSINYIIINYALSNMALLLRNHWLYILFFASEFWVMGNYWRKTCELSKNRVIAGVLVILCFAIHIGLVYFIGRVVGDVVPFRK